MARWFNPEIVKVVLEADGDQVVFYLGTPERVFGGTAVLDGENFELTPEQYDRFTQAGAPYVTEHGIMLREIDIWEEPRFTPDLVPNLSFIENKQYWGSYFQGWRARPIRP